jgi:hypothetical protein
VVAAHRSAIAGIYGYLQEPLDVVELSEDVTFCKVLPAYFLLALWLSVRVHIFSADLAI